jgi:hypothetical protein
LSSAEAEYVTLCNAACDLVLMYKILSQLAMPSTYPLTLKMDVQSAISHIINNANHTQTKHFAVKFNFIEDLYIKGKVALEHIPSEQQLADTLTKAHGPTMQPRCAGTPHAANLRFFHLARFRDVLSHMFFHLTFCKSIYQPP